MKRKIRKGAGFVLDEQGQRRFHGAFSGGFSAGYQNTVGSAEGWTPSNFISSRCHSQKSCPPPGWNPSYADEEDEMSSTVSSRSNFKISCLENIAGLQLLGRSGIRASVGDTFSKKIHLSTGAKANLYGLGYLGAIRLENRSMNSFSGGPIEYRNEVVSSENEDDGEEDFALVGQENMLVETSGDGEEIFPGFVAVNSISASFVDAKYAPPVVPCEVPRSHPHHQKAPSALHFSQHSTTNASTIIVNKLPLPKYPVPLLRK
jgi:hypothetical protein